MAEFYANVRIVDSDGNPQIGVPVSMQEGFNNNDFGKTDDDGWVELEISTLMNSPVSVHFKVGMYAEDYGPYIIEPGDTFDGSFTFDG